MEEENSYFKDFHFLATLHKNRATAEDIESHITATLEQIRTHIQMAWTLNDQWTHHLLTTTGATFTAGEVVVATSRMWKTATYAKEKLLNLAQRFMLFDSIYQMMANHGRIPTKRRTTWLQNKEHDTKSWATRVHQHLERLDRNISDIEDEMSRAEKQVYEEKIQNKEPFISVFNKTVASLEVKLDGIASKLVSCNSQETSQHSPTKRKLDDIEEGPSTSKVHILSDDEYMKKLIDENKDDNDDDPPEAAERRSAHESEEQERNRREQAQYGDDQIQQQEEERQQYIIDLERELEGLYRGRLLLPQRKIGEVPEGPVRVNCAFCGRAGHHFSDSCTTITDGQERYDFIVQEDRCLVCLKKGHRTRDCFAKDKTCWYCGIVQDTALAFLISRQAHHRAICTIPDAKDRITERIRMVREQIRDAMYR